MLLETKYGMFPPSSQSKLSDKYEAFNFNEAWFFFLLWNKCLVLYLKNHCHLVSSRYFTSLSSSFIVVSFTFGFVIYFQLTFVKSVDW